VCFCTDSTSITQMFIETMRICDYYAFLKFASNNLSLAEQPSTSGKADLSNVAVLNTDFMKSIDVIKDNSESQLPALSPLSNAKVRL